MTTAYDRVSYPSAVFPQTHPDRLAVLAMLAGLSPPDPATARILEVGGGDCLNLMSIAAVYPECVAHGFDLSEVAVARGQEIADGAGLDNVRIVVEDICNARERYRAGTFDYVLVHGVYAWVPPHVREAILELIAHVLSDNGIAFVSYNAMPGGHIRLILRQLLLNYVADVEDPEHKLAMARSVLESYSKPEDDDDDLVVTMRKQAESMLERPDAVLFHDELGACFHPQSLADVLGDARRHGLRFLTDAGKNRHLDGYLAEDAEETDDPDGEVELLAMREDSLAMRFFRSTALIRDDQVPDRRIDVSRIAPLYLSTTMQRQEDGSFKHKKDTIELRDEELALALVRAAAAYPQRIAVADLARTPEQLRILLQLFAQWYVNLHPGPAGFVASPGPYPESSPLVRGLISTGVRRLCGLDQSLLNIDQPELRALLMAADGTRSMAEVAAAGHGIPPDEVPDALAGAAQRGLMRR